MSDYTKTTNFTAKDALPSGNPSKVIKGSEHDTEYDNISSMSATKANKKVPATANNIATLSSSGDLQDAGWKAANIAGNITASHTEINYLVGVTSAIQTQLNAKQASDADLTAIAALAKTNGNFIVGNGSTWVVESGSTARASLGFGASGAFLVEGDLANDAVTMNKIDTATSMAGLLGANQKVWDADLTWTASAPYSSWTNFGDDFRIYIPSDATTLHYSAKINSTTPSYYCHFRLKVGTTYSSLISTISTTPIWDEETMDVSALSGWVTLEMQGSSGAASSGGDIRALSWYLT